VGKMGKMGMLVFWFVDGISRFGRKREVVAAGLEFDL
jgi:hypothetical protein